MTQTWSTYTAGNQPSSLALSLVPSIQPFRSRSLPIMISPSLRFSSPRKAALYAKSTLKCFPENECQNKNLLMHSHWVWTCIHFCVCMNVHIVYIVHVNIAHKFSSSGWYWDLLTFCYFVSWFMMNFICGIWAYVSILEPLQKDFSWKQNSTQT